MFNFNEIRNKTLYNHKRDYGFFLMIFSILFLFLFLYIKPDLLSFNSNIYTIVNESVILNTSLELYSRYFNQNLDSINNISVKLEDNLYNVNLNITDSNPINFYFTLDGKYFLDVYDINELILLLNPIDKININQSDKPVVDLYVMSLCPYSNRAEETIFPVYYLLKDKVTWNFNYIIKEENNSFNSLYGPNDISQTIREICVLKKYGLESYISFVNYTNYHCGGTALCWEDVINKLKLNISEINSCYESEGFNILRNESEKSLKVNISKSPTMMINNLTTDVIYNYNDSENYKKIICSAFNSPPEECSIILN